MRMSSTRTSVHATNSMQRPVMSVSDFRLNFGCPGLGLGTASWKPSALPSIVPLPVMDTFFCATV